RHFIEASFTNQLLPNRDIGLEAFGALAGGLFRYRLGVFDGAANNDWAGVTGNTDSRLTLSGRLSVSPFKKQDNLLAGLALGIGASLGSEKAASPAIKTGSQQEIPGTDCAMDGDHLRIAPAIAWFPGKPYSAIAEYALDRFERATDGATITNTAWRVSGGVVLTGEKATPRGVSPARPFSLEDGAWGAFEVTGRVSGLDIDTNLGPVPSGAFSYGVGLHWYLNNIIQARFGLEKSNYSDAPAAPGNELYFFSRLQLLF
ncbi:MAG: porin, partial [Opitutaceae bacterium]|nr:porin [Opitutaceae bacterium]